MIAAAEQTVYRIAMERISDDPLEEDVEAWDTIPDFPDYAASTHGRIKRITRGPHTRPGLILKQHIDRKGPKREKPYYRIGLYRNFVLKLVPVHRLIATTWLGPRPPGYLVAHGDDNGLNNILWNLRYATPKENSEDAIRNGKMHFGDRNGHSSVSNSTIVQIRALRASGMSHIEIASRFGITRNYSCRVCRYLSRKKG